MRLFFFLDSGSPPVAPEIYVDRSSIVFHPNLLPTFLLDTLSL
jgi:hypothetical protein